MDDSSIPRCIFIFLVVCLLLTTVLSVKAGIDTYGDLKDRNSLKFASVSDFCDLGIIYEVGIFIPLCYYVFFALKNRTKQTIKRIEQSRLSDKTILNC